MRGSTRSEVLLGVAPLYAIFVVTIWVLDDYDMVWCGRVCCWSSLSFGGTFPRRCDEKR